EISRNHAGFRPRGQPPIAASCSRVRPWCDLGSVDLFASAALAAQSLRVAREGGGAGCDRRGDALEVRELRAQEGGIEIGRGRLAEVAVQAGEVVAEPRRGARECGRVAGEGVRVLLEMGRLREQRLVVAKESYSFGRCLARVRGKAAAGCGELIRGRGQLRS